MPEANTILIIYTTLYRKGGNQFPAVARTLADEKLADGYKGEIICRVVESKRNVLQVLAEIRDATKKVDEFHFVGHSGMYGPMFGTVAFPEQFSPHEWENLDIPFADNASASFHCCRSARWFAPYFARTFNVTANGFFWYTTFSTSKTSYAFAGESSKKPLYTIGCKGRKSHGLSASVRKRVGLMPAEEMKSFQPGAVNGADTYNEVAELYDAAFTDIRVRRDEWEWLNNHLPEGEIDVLDIGCGNGALLTALSGRIRSGIGVDESASMIERARLKIAGSGQPDIGESDLKSEISDLRSEAVKAPNRDYLVSSLELDPSEISHSRSEISNFKSEISETPELKSNISNLKFTAIKGPVLPFADDSFDITISLMSFRYLDWDPLLREIKRVTRPGGRLLIIDMVTVPVAAREYPRLLKDKLRTMRHQKANARFDGALKKLVSHPDWKKMLEFNPIRSEHEMKWYLESRFPSCKMEVLNMAWNSRIVAFDSGPVENGIEAKLSYP